MAALGPFHACHLWGLWESVEGCPCWGHWQDNVERTMQLACALPAFQVCAEFPRNPEFLALGPHALSQGEMYLLSQGNHCFWAFTRRRVAGMAFRYEGLGRKVGPG